MSQRKRIHTPICDLLEIEHPIILGGMMGISDGSLSAAVSEAGGLGTISSATYGDAGTRTEIAKALSLTHKPIAVNLPIFHPMVPTLIDILIEMGVKIAVTSAGSPHKYTARLQEAGVTVLHVVSSVRTALKAQDAGVDAIVAEGVESGGKVSPEEVPTISLIPQAVDAIEKPVIAAGGLADGRGLAAMLALGAQGIQLGTRFIAASEAPVHVHWKQALVRAGDNATGVALRKSSPTRLIRNRFFDEFDAMDEPGKKALDYFPAQAQGIARIPNDPEGVEGSYIAGCGAGLVKGIQPAGEIVAEIVREAIEAIETVGRGLVTEE